MIRILLDLGVGQGSPPRLDGRLRRIEDKALGDGLLHGNRFGSARLPSRGLQSHRRLAGQEQGKRREANIRRRAGTGENDPQTVQQALRLAVGQTPLLVAQAERDAIAIACVQEEAMERMIEETGIDIDPTRVGIMDAVIQRRRSEAEDTRKQIESLGTADLVQREETVRFPLLVEAGDGRQPLADLLLRCESDVIGKQIALGRIGQQGGILTATQAGENEPPKRKQEKVG
jgi:hypothetical protein